MTRPSPNGAAEIDRDRQAVYDLEDVAFGGTVFDDRMPFADAAHLVDAFCRSTPWAGLALPVPRVAPTRSDSLTSSARCDADGASLHLSPDGCTVAVIAHELAHVLAGQRSAGRDGPAHGPAFRRADVALVGALMGADAAGRLAGAFADAGLALGAELDGVPRPNTVGFWMTWRSARALDQRPAPSCGPIAL